MVRSPGVTWWRGLAVLGSALLFLLFTAGAGEAIPATPEERVFPWLALPVILIMSFCLLVIFLTTDNQKETDRSSHEPVAPAGHGADSGEAEAGS